MVEIRQFLPDDAGKGNRSIDDGHRQVFYFHPLVFAKVAGSGAGILSVSLVAFLTAAGYGFFMAGTGEQENFLMARAHGDHARSADDDEQKGN